MPVSPRGFREAFERAGYKIVAQDRFNWFMARGDDDRPLMIPKRGQFVSIDIMESIAHGSDDRLRGELMKQVDIETHAVDTGAASKSTQ